MKNHLTTNPLRAATPQCTLFGRSHTRHFTSLKIWNYSPTWTSVTTFLGDFIKMGVFFIILNKILKFTAVISIRDVYGSFTNTVCFLLLPAIKKKIVGYNALVIPMQMLPFKYGVIHLIVHLSCRKLRGRNKQIVQFQRNFTLFS